MNDHEQIDRQKALLWLEGDERMLAKIRDIFMRNVPSQVEQLRAFLDARDSGSAERIAHTIMGSSAMLGASSMSDAAGKIEQSAIQDDMNSAQIHFTSFVGEYEKVMAELSVKGRNNEYPDC